MLTTLLYRQCGDTESTLCKLTKCSTMQPWATQPRQSFADRREHERVASSERPYCTTEHHGSVIRIGYYAGTSTTLDFVIF